MNTPRTPEVILADLQLIVSRFQELQTELANQIQCSRETPIRAAVLHAAKFECVPPNAITSRLRNGPVARARQIAYWLLRKEGWTTGEIAVAFKRDHGAICHGIRQVMNRLATEPRFNEQLSKIS